MIIDVIIITKTLTKERNLKMENKQLQKSLGIAAALSTVVGMVIGGGVFFKPQAVYTLTGGAPGQKFQLQYLKQVE